jgi:two-component sensor histidine kinase
MMVASLVRLQSNSMQNQIAKDAIAETEARIYAKSDEHKKIGLNAVVPFTRYCTDATAHSH